MANAKIALMVLGVAYVFASHTNSAKYLTITRNVPTERIPKKFTNDLISSSSGPKSKSYLSIPTFYFIFIFWH